jgi:hypothetical protein
MTPMSFTVPTISTDLPPSLISMRTEPYVRPLSLPVESTVKSANTVHGWTGETRSDFVVYLLPEEVFGPKDRLIRSIESLAHLPPDWAGKGTIGPNEQTKKRAQEFALALKSGRQLPQASASADGEIGFVWFSPKGRVEAILQPDGHLVSIGKFGNEFGEGEDAVWNGTLPPGLTRLLDRLFA